MNTELNVLIEQRITLESSVDDVTNELEKLQILVDNFEYECTEDHFNEILDCDGVQNTSVGSFYPSDILKSCDPTAYRCAKSDYESSYDLHGCEEYTDMLLEITDLENKLDDLTGQLDELQESIDDELKLEFQEKANNYDD